MSDYQIEYDYYIGPRKFNMVRAIDWLLCGSNGYWEQL